MSTNQLNYSLFARVTLLFTGAVAVSLAGACGPESEDGLDSDPGDDAPAYASLPLNCGSDTGRRPAMREVPYDGIDNDCNPLTPDDDIDGDGYGVDDDCDDGDANAWRGTATWRGTLDAETAALFCRGSCERRLVGDLDLDAMQPDDVAALSCLVAVSGDVHVENDTLVDLVGLEQLQHIGGDLRIDNSDALVSIAALGALTSVGGDVSIDTNASLGSLAGLQSLRSVGGDLTVSHDYALQGLAGLDALSTVGGSLGVRLNPLIPSLQGLGALSRVGGDLEVSYNAYLDSLSGAEALYAVGGGVTIAANESLCEDDVAAFLTQLTEVGGAVDTSGNAVECAP